MAFMKSIWIFATLVAIVMTSRLELGLDSMVSLTHDTEFEDTNDTNSFEAAKSIKPAFLTSQAIHPCDCMEAIRPDFDKKVYGDKSTIPLSFKSYHSGVARNQRKSAWTEDWIEKNNWSNVGRIFWNMDIEIDCPRVTYSWLNDTTSLFLCQECEDKMIEVSVTYHKQTILGINGAAELKSSQTKAVTEKYQASIKDVLEAWGEGKRIFHFALTPAFQFPSRPPFYLLFFPPGTTSSSGAECRSIIVDGYENHNDEIAVSIPKLLDLAEERLPLEGSEQKATRRPVHATPARTRTRTRTNMGDAPVTTLQAERVAQSDRILPSLSSLFSRIPKAKQLKTPPVTPVTAIPIY